MKFEIRLTSLKINKLIMVLILYVFLVPMNLSNAGQDNITNPSNITIKNSAAYKLEETVRKNGTDLYFQLMKIRKENDFKNNGFKYSEEYKKWKHQAEGLADYCMVEAKKLYSSGVLEEETFSLCEASLELASIGVDYALNRGEDNKQTTKSRKEIESIFKITPTILKKKY